MSYEHCEEHNEDATNGCMSCEIERVRGLSDATVIWEILASARGWSRVPYEPLVDRAREIGGRLATDASPASKIIEALAEFKRRDESTVDAVLRLVEDWRSRNFKDSLQ